MEESLLIAIIVIITSVIQSLVGIGVLLFGTPLMLILGFNYFELLNILLPISLIINFFQFINDYKSIDKELAFKLVTMVLPLIAIILTLAKYIQFDFSVAVGVFLIFISISKVLNFNIKSIVEGRLYLAAMGVVHGLTNLGGSLLAGYVSIKDWNKIKTRTNIAFCYFSFALTQLITLFVNDKSDFNKNNIIYIFLGTIIYFLANKYIFKEINESKFSNIVTILLFIFGIILITINL
jgi:uncharacterized protein